MILISLLTIGLSWLPKLVFHPLVINKEVKRGIWKIRRKGIFDKSTHIDVVGMLLFFDLASWFRILDV